MILQVTRVTSGSIWGHVGVASGTFLAYGGSLDAYTNKFDVDKHEMASVMGICGSLVVHFGATLGHFGITWEPLGSHLGTLGSHFGALWRHFRVSLG